MSSVKVSIITDIMLSVDSVLSHKTLQWKQDTVFFLFPMQFFPFSPITWINSHQHVVSGKFCAVWCCPGCFCNTSPAARFYVNEPKPSCQTKLIAPMCHYSMSVMWLCRINVFKIQHVRTVVCAASGHSSASLINQLATISFSILNATAGKHTLTQFIPPLNPEPVKTFICNNLCK